MTQIPSYAIPHFEAGIYLPMLLVVLEKDISMIEDGDFKFKKPYVYMIDEIRTKVEKDLKEAKAYFTNNKMRLKRGETDELFTEYYFYFESIIECRRYSNIRLRNHSEELLMSYLNGFKNLDG